jgi:hypothetical protein
LNINEKEKHALVEELKELQSKSTALEEGLKKKLTASEKARSDKDTEVPLL